MDQKLADLFQKKQQEAAIAAIDWDDRRDKYLAAVNSLYEQIKTILSEPISQKMVVVDRRTKSLTENYIGTYSADDLILAVGNEQVRFSPRGRNMVGAAGRVDVIGERSEAMLVLQGSEWGFVEARQPQLRVAPFDESTLAEVLRIVMRD